MREIVISMVLVVVISIVAAFALQAMDWSAESKFQSSQGNVRVR